MNIDRRLFKNLDGPLIAATVALLLFGLVAVYSATHQLVSEDSFYYVKRQLIWIVVGCVGAVVILFLDYTTWKRYSRIVYALTLALLGAVLVIAPTISGAGRWIVLGPVQLQPSEFAKLAIIVTLAKHLSESHSEYPLRNILGSILHLAAPMALVLMQPDLGTTFVFIGILFGMLFVSGTRIKHLAILAFVGISCFAAAAFVSSQGWLPIFKEYQLKRLFVFLDPYSDRTNAGWNVIQSMIAIGSGGFFGKGLLAGSQTQLNFVPARHTDFIFSVIGEEMGFLGAFLLLSLYLFFLLRSMRLIASAKDSFGALLIAGVLSMMFVHIAVNIGMTLGVMPVTGIPLPFASVGGTALISNLIGVGIMLNVTMRRHKILF